MTTEKYQEPPLLSSPWLSHAWLSGHHDRVSGRSQHWPPRHHGHVTSPIDGPIPGTDPMDIIPGREGLPHEVLGSYRVGNVQEDWVGAGSMSPCRKRSREWSCRELTC